MNEQQLWKNLENNNLKEVIDNADHIYNSTKSLSALRSKVTALILLKDYDKAHELANRIFNIEQNEEYPKVLGAGYSKTHYEYPYFMEDSLLTIGIINFIKGDFQDSLDSLKKADEAYYRGISRIDNWLMIYAFSVINNKNEHIEKSINKLNAYLKQSKNLKDISVEIVEFLLDQINQDQLLSQISKDDPLKTRKLCKSYFYSAIKNFSIGDLNRYKESLQNCLNNKTLIENEYFIAKYLSEK